VPDHGVTAVETGTELACDLFERYHEDIFIYLYGLVHERAWAQDLAQDTFVRVLRARRRLLQVDNHRAWLYRIATNVGLTALKRRRRFAWLPWRASDRSAGCPPEVAEQAGTGSAVEVALASLRPGYRAALLLHAHYGLSTAEVAGALGLSQAAARKRIYRACEMFRQAYSKGDAK
jgi:RNA polymerase sigma-70 factor (ECF subfamily)